MGVAGKVVLVGGGVAAGAGLFYWLLLKNADGPGDGKWGFGGGFKGGTKPGGVEESGPLSEDGGDGGHGTEDTGGADKGKGQGGGDTSSGGGSDSSGSTDSRGKGNDDKGNGKGKGKGDGEGGSGGSGGGHGSGSGGGIGSGDGQGTGGDFDEGGNDGVDGGGGDDEGLYDPWEGLLIVEDIPAPDLSDHKLSELHATISDLVVYSVLDPGTFHPNLPGPLHAFDPELGGLLKFWADVAIHLTYDLPSGRLDPDVTSHVPWINLWLDTYAVAATIEAEINGSLEA